MTPPTKSEPQETSGTSTGRRIEELLSRLVEQRPSAMMLVLLAWYVLLIWKSVGRPLWYDELYTFYIAQQPTWTRMFEAIRAIDLNPPLNYILTRWSLQAFGDSPWAARLPAVVSFAIAGLTVFLFLRRRTGAVYAALGVLLLWGSPYLMYAAEARPYALLIAFSALLLLGWDYAISGRRKTGLAIVWLAGLGLLSSHILGVFPLGALWCAEAARAWKKRTWDWALSLALLAPAVVIFTYKPMLQSYGEVIFPAEAKASLLKAYYLYFAVLRWMWRPLVALAVIAVAWRRTRASAGTQSSHSMPTHLGVALGVLFVIPLGVNLLFMLSHGAFYDRYGLPIALAIAVAAPMVFAQATGGNERWATRGLVMVALLLGLQTAGPQLVRAASRMMPQKAALKTVNVVAPIGSSPFKPWWKKLPVPERILQEKAQAPLVKSLQQVSPELPVVAASELTFLEMDHREPPQVVSRLHYLTSREAAIAISHRSYSEEVGALRKYFPIRGAVQPYQEFVAGHRKFLVLSAYEYPGDWLLRKLEQDGAGLRVVARYSGYKDTELYEVTLPERKVMIVVLPPA